MVTTESLAPGQWLTATDHEKVEKKYIREVVQVLLKGSTKHPFAESTGYDVLLEDGTRLAPKAVFGVAARRALNLDIRPSHFRGGEGTPCFRLTRTAGFAIVPKGGDGHVPLPESCEWIEGDVRRKLHQWMQTHMGRRFIQHLGNLQ